MLIDGSGTRAFLYKPKVAEPDKVTMVLRNKLASDQGIRTETSSHYTVHFIMQSNPQAYSPM